MITDESQSTMQLERSKVNVSAYLEKTELMGSTVAASSSFDQAMKSLVLRLEATLYGRDVASETTESNPIMVEVFDPDNIQDIPETWWDHLKLDMSEWLYRRSLRGWWRYRDFAENLHHWLYSRVNTVPAPQSHRPKTIAQAVRIRKVTAVCPHVGSQAKIDRHLQFVVFKTTDPCGAFNVVPMDLDNGVTHPVETSQAWREHVFRHHLLAICEKMNNQFGPASDLFSCRHDSAEIYRHLMEIKDLFDQYGVGV